MGRRSYLGSFRGHKPRTALGWLGRKSVGGFKRHARKGFNLFRRR